MSGLGWTALGAGGLALAAAVLAVVLALKLAAATKALATSTVETASARYEVGKLTGERDLVVAELDELRRRHAKEMGDLRREVESLQDQLLADNATPEQLRDALARATRRPRP